MTRLHTDPVEVRSERDAPAQFLWRGRLYLVREVLARWTESGQWWRTDAVRALTRGDSAGGGPGPGQLPLRRGWAESASLAGPAGSPRPVDSATGLSEGGGALALQAQLDCQLDDGEREWWRVEAGTGRHEALTGGTGVYDLCFDGARGSWSLARVQD